METPAPRAGARTRVTVGTAESDRRRDRADHVATEEPLEIRLVAGSNVRTIAVTMRTPGADFELAVGFLFGEGIVSSKEDVRQVSYCVDPEIDPEQHFNIVNVELSSALMPDLRALERHFYTSSACGVCGKATLESLQERGFRQPPSGPRVAATTIYELPDKLLEAQGVFESTGGLHACGLFDPDGRLLCLREDVGRHNAVDKVVGWALLNEQLPLHDRIALVSGRSSYEILQKCLAAGVPIVCSVSAPSSLAVAVAAEFGMTLLGFLRDRRVNIYAGEARLSFPD
jgi:FdhD protein